MGYQNRRYRVVDGKLEKRWDAPGEGWFVTKADAWAAVAAAKDEAPPEGVGLTPPYDQYRFKQLRAEIKRRTGKGPKRGTNTAGLIEALDVLDEDNAV